MSKYTMQLRKVIDLYGEDEVKSWFTNYELTDYLTPSQIEVINNNGVWNKQKLASKIIDHYFMREIGFETPALFKHYAKVSMKEIMERKLPLIYSRAIEYDPLINVDYVETFDRNINARGNSNSTSNNISSGLGVNSDTPQGQINKDEILNGKYATSVSASEADSQSTDNSQTSSDSNELYTKKVKGNSGVSATAQKMIEQFRENIIAIDEDIIKELNDLFFGLY